MKILFVTGSLGSGGAERVLSIIANNFCQMSDVSIITIYNSNIDYEIDKRIKVLDYSSLGTTRQLKTILKLRKYMRQNKPDVIISFLSNVNIYTIFASIFLKMKIIISERNDPNNEPSSKIGKIIRRFVYNRTSILVCQTEMAKDYFYWYKNEIAIITNPIKKIDLQRNFDKPLKVIYTAARLSTQKNIPLLIDAFDNFYEGHKDYELHIYGDGEERENIQESINQKKSRLAIKLKGFSKTIHQEVIDNYMFVLTSDYEGIPNALIEAMSMGIPAIATDCPIGGTRSLINSNENGILIPVRDKDTLIKSMEELASNSDLYNKISNNSQNINVTNSESRIIEQWYSLVKKIL